MVNAGCGIVHRIMPSWCRTTIGGGCDFGGLAAPDRAIKLP
jgi:hypothetical protein